jgi:carbamoyl-phosphate synthase large subunit
MVMNKIILVTGIGGDIGQSVLKCLKDLKRGFKIIGCDKDCYAAGKLSCDKFFIAPGAGTGAKYMDFIRELVENEGVEYILPVSEPEIEVYNANRGYFETKDIKLFIHSPFIIETFLDKYVTAQFLKNNGLLCPRTYLLNDFNDQMSFPVLLKMRKGCGAKGQVIIEDAEELSFYKRRLEGAIVQEIVGSNDEEYTVGVFSNGEDVYTIAFKRYLGYGSLTKIAQLVYDDRIRDSAEKIARACKLEGSFNIQFRKTREGYVPLEINPRFSSTVYIRHCFGFQDVAWWIDLKEGRRTAFVPRYKEGVAVRSINEAFFDMVSL